MPNNEIWGLVDEVWQTIEDGYNKYKRTYFDLVFHGDKKEEYNELFKNYYKTIKEKHMTDGTTILDSHKQAAILIMCCLQLNVVEHPLTNADEISIVPQLIAINVGLSYMLECLNRTLRKKKIRSSIERYYFPVAIACDTPYQEIMCRLLLQEQNRENMDMHILELSDRLFLLEYINLLQHGIAPELLKENE